MKRTTIILHLLLVISLLLVGFGATNGWGLSAVYGAPSLQAAVPTLSVRAGLTAQPGDTITVPIDFENDGVNDISTMLFSIDYDQSCLAFDDSDNNNDGLPDSITFNPAIPAQALTSASFDASDVNSELDFAIISFSSSPPPIPDLAPLVSIEFTVICTPTGATEAAAVLFAAGSPPSFSDGAGNPIPGASVDGAVTVQGTVPTATATDVPPTATSTSVPPTATATNVPPTATSTNTPIPPTATPTTDVPPLFTSTSTSTPVPNLPTLIIQSQTTAAGSSVAVPIEFQAGDQDVASLAFSIDYDQTCLAFDPTDADNDSLPDAITFFVPQGFSITASFDGNDTDGEIDVVIVSNATPPPSLADTNPLLTITFMTTCNPTGASHLAPVSFGDDPGTTFGNPAGDAVPGVTVDGMVTVTAVATPTTPPTATVPPTATSTGVPTLPPPATSTATPTDVPTLPPPATSTATPTDVPTLPPPATSTATPTATPSPSDCPALASLLQNPGFEEGTDHWKFYTSGSGHFTTGAPAYECEEAAVIQVDQRGRNVQLYQTRFTLQPHTAYRLTFAAKSNTGNNMGLYIHEHDDDYTNYGLRVKEIDLTTDWQEFTYEFTTKNFTNAVHDSRIRFWLSPYAQPGDTYMIDKVVLLPVNGTPATPTATPMPSPTPGGTGGTCTPTASLLDNPSYENGKEEWRFHTSSAGSWNTVSDAFECNQAARVHIDQSGNNVQLYQVGFTLKADTRYHLSFAAKSSSGRDMGLYIHEHDNDYSNYGLAVQTVDLGTGWQIYNYEFNTKNIHNSAKDSRIRFWFAPHAEAGDLYMIDQVVLQEVGAATAAGEEANPTNIYLPVVSNE